MLVIIFQLMLNNISCKVLLLAHEFSYLDFADSFAQSNFPPLSYN